MITLLSTVVENSTTNSTISYITSIIVCILFLGAAIFGIYKGYKTGKINKERLNSFFEKMQETVKQEMIVYIQNFDFKNIKEDFGNTQAILLENLYDKIWKVFEYELDHLYGEDLVYISLKKILDKDKVIEYVNIIFSEDEIQDKLADLYNEALSKENLKIEEEDKELAKEAEENFIQDIDNAENEIVEDEGIVPVLDPMKLNGIDNGEEVIIPPSEEESDTVSADDESIEIIE